MLGLASIIHTNISHFNFRAVLAHAGCEVERAHLLSDVIQNLEADGEFYMKRTITVRLRERDALYKALANGLDQLN